MGKHSFLKVLCAIAVSLALGLTTEPLLAQRGGHGGGGFHGGGGGGFHGGGGGGFHGGGGGFHGGGGYSGFHGGGFHGGATYSGGGYRGATGFRSVGRGPVYGGYRGAGFYGGRSYGWGYGGGRGWGYPVGWGGWGYPGFGWGGWGIGLSFNFGGFWGPGYAYPYAYAPPVVVAPPCYYYASPCYAPSGYAPANPGSYHPGSYDIDSQDYQDNQNNYPTGYSNTNYANPQSTNYAGPTSQQLAETAVRQVPEARPEVRNAIRALSGMPPAARERELATGLYAGFSRDERQVVRAAAFTPVPNRKSETVIRTAVQAPEQHRREVQNAIRTLQAMPPAAREREINSGVYSNFSPSERQMLKTVAQVQQGM